jgi:hypothetical protein
MPEDLHMSSQDTKEKQLLDQIQSARHSEGIESAAAFEQALHSKLFRT